MERYEGIARLQWWTNSCTTLLNVPVTVVITAVDGGGWDARGQLVDRDSEVTEDVALLSQDPLFTLQFDDGSRFDVLMSDFDTERGTFTCTEAGPALEG